MRSVLSYYLCVLSFGITFNAISQNQQLRAFTLEDGLPQSQVYAITQDEKGYLWLGTQGGGVARFDGKDFEVYNENSGLASNYIYALKASEKRLFIGSRTGLSIKTKDDFFNIEGPQVNEILKFGDTIYLLTQEGLWKLEGSNRLQKILFDNDIDQSQLRDLIFDGSKFWLATNKGLWTMDDLESETNYSQHDFNDYTNLVQFESKIIASTFNSGTLIIEGNIFDDAVLIQPNLRVTHASIQNGNQLWLATDNQGIIVIDTEGFQELYRINPNSGLPTSNVREVITDQFSNIWIATSGGGIYKYYQNDFKFYNESKGLKGNRIYAVHYAKDQVWFSTSEAGLMQIEDSRVKDIQLPESFSNVKIKTITSHSNGNIWAGSDGKGLLFKGKVYRDSISRDTIKGFKKKIPFVAEKTVVLNSNSGFPFDWIRSVYTENDTVWAATYSNGIVKFSYNPGTDQLSFYKTYSNLDGLEDMAITCMQKDNNNRLWYATESGHLGFYKDNKIQHMGSVLDQNIGINTIRFYKGLMFLGTAGKGIWWSDGPSYSVFKKLKGTKVLTSENINQLIFDRSGYLWSGSERGVDKIELSTEQVINDVLFFGNSEGFLGIETCMNAVDMDNDGHIWFGAINGLVEYLPSETETVLKPPKVFIEDIKIDYKSIASLSAYSKNSQNELQLSSDQRQIGFTFRTIDIDHPHGIEYRFRLNDEPWSPWSAKNIQDFSELNFGSYTFEVQSRNYRWKESEPVRITFNIETPLFRKTWFQSLVFGSIVLLIIWLIRQYIKRVKHKSKQEQKRLQLENHLLSLEQKALRLQMNPHFIFNVLNGIKAMANNKPEKMNDTINNFASLLRETLANSRQETISLAQEIKTLEHYISVEQLMATKPFTFDIKLNSNIDAEEILMPSMLVQPFVENAIRHGILKGPREGELKIVFEVKQNDLKVAIEDNGIGIYQSQKKNVNTDHQSMAIKVTTERLESIAGSSALDIQEIKLKDGAVIGTLVTFSIPLETDY